MMVLSAVFGLLLVFASPASAVTLTGVLVYSTDDFGDPSGYATFDNPYVLEGQVWRTFVAGNFHALALLEGLPPQSVAGRRKLLSAADFSIFIPLAEGENFFTIAGDPGAITDGDQYYRYSLNLYFDGGDQVPGISVLFPRYGTETGETVIATRSEMLYSLGATLSQRRTADGPDPTYYDDGFFRVSVTGASFIPAEHQSEPINILGPQSFTPNERADYVGSLVILVEPSAGLGGGGGRPVPGGVPRNPGGSGGSGGSPAPPLRPVVPGFVGGPPAPAPGADYAPDFDDVMGPGAHWDEDPWVGGDAIDREADADEDSRDAIDALRGWLQSAIEDDEADEGEGDPEATTEGDADAVTSPTPETAAPTPTPVATEDADAGVATTTPAATPAEASDAEEAADAETTPAAKAAGTVPVATPTPRKS